MKMRKWAGTPLLGTGILTLVVGVALFSPITGLTGGGAALTATNAPEYVSNGEDATTGYSEVKNVPITMSDGVILEADEYVPSTCSAAEPCPVLLIQTPYRKSAVSLDVPYLYEHGYIEVVADVRGTGSSEGYWDSLGPREQQDGAELVQWVANPAHLPTNGQVGLAGASYGGINQLLTVEAVNDDIAGHGPLTDPGSGCVSSATFNCGNPTGITGNPIEAIFPQVAMSDAYRDVVLAGGTLDTAFIPAWLGLVNGLGVVPGQGIGEPPSSENPQIALNAESQHVEDLYLFSGSVVADAALGSYESLLPEELQTYPQAAYDGPFFQVRSPITHIEQVNVPTFLIGGTYDIFQRGEPTNFNALDLPAGEKKLVIGPWYHNIEGSGLPATDNQGNVIPDEDNLQLAWFDHWMDNPDSTGPTHSAADIADGKGTANGIETFPTVEAYRLGADQWVPQTQYPAAATTGQRWYLAGSPSVGGASGTLSTAAPSTVGSATLPALTAIGACSRSTLQWSGTGGVAGTLPVCEQNSTPTEVQGLEFTSQPAKSPYVINGPIEADIYMSSTASDSALTATVSDVSSAGADDITAGTLVASLRQVTGTVCPSRPVAGGRSATYEIVRGCSVRLDGQSIEPWHPYTPTSQAPLQAGKVYLLQIEIFPTSAVIEAGHQLRVTITAGNEPVDFPPLSTTANSAGVDTFYLGPVSSPQSGVAASSIYLGTTTPANAT